LDRHLSPLNASTSLLCCCASVGTCVARAAAASVVLCVQHRLPHTHSSSPHTGLFSSDSFPIARIPARLIHLVERVFAHRLTLCGGCNVAAATRPGVYWAVARTTRARQFFSDRTRHRMTTPMVYMHSKTRPRTTLGGICPTTLWNREVYLPMRESEPRADTRRPM
jgi:hypothetical protein